ncbi:hypothetical protein UFOVP998_23 [uncultured Caudovirales phage]|uniref:Uncharacterized protein n=1 Tax=uncultured Caudovirales phage TaxID=2100421 RepID=A0A6J5RPK9_9CAUD|nr:hypothetical protein UFOVP998_23 [uncultured Caudovirales phage]CAB4199310.1 hypothetical protein UFOVP1331_36 [uncultured Caudovirales phage]CAB4212976.1 hypothetical protein UFOVP1442_39 [uncultured Caudovirales phage]CAB5227969.1 hypothetical protein UFOVP1535_12 [uncultured Caudovirales phage]
MSFFRQSPGACPVCGQAHTACRPVGSSDQIVVAQLPARDGARTHDETLALAHQVNPHAVSTKTYPHRSTHDRSEALASGARRRRP